MRISMSQEISDGAEPISLFEAVEILSGDSVRGFDMSSWDPAMNALLDMEHVAEAIFAEAVRLHLESSPSAFSEMPMAFLSSRFVLDDDIWQVAASEAEAIVGKKKVSKIRSKRSLTVGQSELPFPD